MILERIFKINKKEVVILKRRIVDEHEKSITKAITMHFVKGVYVIK